jgi:CheY-like chemotaxis protein
VGCEMANVLIVGYDTGNSELIRRLLLFRAHETDSVSNSEEAMATLRRYRPDVITINPMLAGPPGLALCERLKSQRATCLIPVVILTSLNDTKTWQQSLRSGSNAHVTMPYTPQELFTAVDQALSWPQLHSARCGAGQIIFDTRNEDERLHQTNDLTVDILTLTSLPEDEVGELKQVVLEMGDRLREWGYKKWRERVESLHWKVERDRINLEIRQDGFPDDCPDDPLSVSLDALVRQCGFVESPGSRTEGPVVLDRIIQA